MRYLGSCHCKAIQFEIDAEIPLNAVRCNCSICKKSGYLHLIIPLQHFTLISGGGNLREYTFNTGVAKHTFCQTCGVKPFYTPRSHPQGIDININCLDGDIHVSKITEFDGINWEQNVDTLPHCGNTLQD